MKLTKQALRGLRPCWTGRQIDLLYEQSQRIHGEKDFFDVEDILHSKIVSKLEILWIVLRPEYVDLPTLRSFAADCAEAALRRDETAGKKVHPSSWEAIGVARKFARGDATDEERAAARKAAVINSDSAKAANWTVAEAYPEVVKAVHWSAMGTTPNSAVRSEEVELLRSRLAARMPAKSRSSE